MPETPIALVVKQIGRKGDLFADRAFRQDIQRINQNTAKAMKRSFQKTVRTWEHPVTFHQITESRPDPTVLVYTDDDIYGYVSGGTRVRYVVMTPDFSPKTRPGLLDSRPGRGGVSHFDFRHPRPGIQARKFDVLVERRHKKRHQREVERAIQRALKAAAI